MEGMISGLVISVCVCFFPMFVPQGAIYGMAQSIPDRSLVTEISHGFLDCLYSTELPKSAQSNGKAMTNGKAQTNGKAH